MLLSLGLLVLISWVVAAQRTRRPYLLVGWLWYLVTLLPVIGLVQVGLQARADRVHLPFTDRPMLGHRVGRGRIGSTGLMGAAGIGAFGLHLAGAVDNLGLAADRHMAKDTQAFGARPWLRATLAKSRTTILQVFRMQSGKSIARCSSSRMPCNWLPTRWKRI